MYTQLECVYNFIRCENGKIESCYALKVMENYVTKMTLDKNNMEIALQIHVNWRIKKHTIYIMRV